MKDDMKDMEDMEDVMENFPLNFPVVNVIVCGVPQATTNFISLANGLAIFKNDAEIKIFDSGSIDGLEM